MTGLSSLDPMVASAEKSIEKMPPDKAIEFLLSKGVNPRLAGLVIKNRMLKQGGQKQAQPPQKTVADDIDSGIAQLPVSGQMFNGGAGVAPQAHFDSGGPVTDYMPQLMQSMYQKAMYQPGQGYQKPSYMMSDEEQAAAAAQAARPQMAGGGIVAFADGDQVPHAQGPYAQQSQDDPNMKAEYVEYLKAHPPQRTPWSQPMGNPFPAVGQAIGAGVRAVDRDIASPAMGVAPPGATPSPPTAQNSIASGVSDFLKSPQAASPPKPPAPPPGPTTGAPPPNTSMNAGASVSMPPGAGQQGHVEQMAQQQIDAANKSAAEFKPQSYEEILASLQNTANQQGIGAAAAAHMQDLEQRKASITQMAQQGKWAAVAQMGFSMAEAATKNPHGGFLGALAVGGQRGGEMFLQTLKDKREATNAVQDQQYAVQQAQENLKTHFSEKALDVYDKQVGHYENAISRVHAANDRLIQTIGGKELQAMQSKAMIAARAQYSPLNEVYRDLLGQVNPDTQKKYTPLEAWKAVEGATSAAQAASTRGTAAENAEKLKLRYGANMETMYTANKRILAKGPENVPADKYKAALDMVKDVDTNLGVGSSGGGAAPMDPQLAAALAKYGGPNK